MALKYFDTYILWEISRANEKFSMYENEEFIISHLTLAEFYGIILREYNEATANYWLKKLLGNTRQVPLQTLIQAMKFRHAHKKQAVSFFDAVGYVFAQENKIPFVTGDKEFKGMPGVEFIQK